MARPNKKRTSPKPGVNGIPGDASDGQQKAPGGKDSPQTAQPPQEATEQPLRNLKTWAVTPDPPVGTVLAWTEQQRADWRTSKEMGRRGHREMAEGIRMAMTSDPPLWSQEYRTSSDYAWGEYGHSRPWLTQEMNWLRRQELLDELCRARGIKEMAIIKEEGEHLAELEDHPDQFVQAMIEAEMEFRSRGKSKKSKATCMKNQVARQRAYLNERKVVTPDLTWQEYESLERLGVSRTYFSEEKDILNEADPTKRREMLTAACRTKRTLPTNQQIAQIARGRDLYALVEALLGLKEGWEDDEELEKAEADVARLKREKAAKAAAAARAAGGVQQFPGQPGTRAPVVPEPAAPQPEGPKAEYEYELELTGDLVGLVRDTKRFAADQLPLAVAGLARAMAGHPITKDSSLHIKVRKK
jgi:hypothetical protein